MASIFLSFIVFFAVTAFALYMIYQFLTNFSPGKSKILTDFRAMRDEVREWTAALVPMTKEEMSLLSPRQVNQKIKRGLNKTAKGIFVSIYEEPLVLYTYKKYIAAKKNAILYARTSKTEFAYRITKKGIDINIDGQYAGVLKENGGFYGGRRNRLLARINRADELQLHPVVIGDREVASVVNPTKSSKHNPRAFQFLKPMEANEEKVFLALAVLEMVQESLRDEF